MLLIFMHLRQQSVALFFLQNEAQRQQQQKMQQNKFLLSLFSSSHDPTLYFCVLKKCSITFLLKFQTLICWLNKNQPHSL